MRTLKLLVTSILVAVLTACSIHTGELFDTSDAPCRITADHGEENLCDIANNRQIFVPATTNSAATLVTFTGESLSQQPDTVNVICYDADSSRFGVVGDLDNLPENREAERWALGRDKAIEHERIFYPVAFVGVADIVDADDKLRELEAELMAQFGSDSTDCNNEWLTISTAKNAELLSVY